MDVRLTPELEDLVREKVETGLYRDESEVVAEALRLLDRVEQGSEPQLDRLREARNMEFHGLVAGVADDIGEGREHPQHQEAPGP